MITDQDVADLYRCLLGRAPESADTIAAFRAYYSDFTRGRQAILQSTEFATLMQAHQGNTAARLAHAFLQRAGGAAWPAELQPRDDIRGTMQLILRAHGAIHLAVVIGGADMPIDDLLPLQTAQSVVMHIVKSAPPLLPQVAALPGGGTLFRIAFDAAGLAAFLLAEAMRIDLLAVFGEDPAWFAALQLVLAGRAVLIADARLPEQTAAWPQAERELQISDIYMRFLGGWFLPVIYAPPMIPLTPPCSPIPGLCIAAIMRNEQAAAVNMLRSVTPVAESFVVVDTGSTDNTMQLVDEYLQTTGKPFTLHTHIADRFDEMRNAAIDLAPPGSTWILMLDADEELCAEDHAGLRTLLADANQDGDKGAADAYALPRYNYTGLDKCGEVTPYPDRQVRLLRCTAGRHVRYSGAVHETVRDAAILRLALDASALGLDRGGPHIHHLVRRFRSAEAEARKQDHYRQIAERHAATPGN